MTHTLNKPARQKSFSKMLALFAASALAFSVGPALAVPLNFSDYFGQATGTTVIGNSVVIEQSEVLFRGVAKDDGRIVDAKITTEIKEETDFAETGGDGFFGNPGFIPDYVPRGGDQNVDLGFLFYGNGINETENGITVKIEFFDGTNDLSGTFKKSIDVSKIEFAIYDVDGESKVKGSYNDQTEGFRAFTEDGLTSYMLGVTEQALTATQDNGVVFFEGPGKNFAEDDASGAAILIYENTNMFTLDFASVQSSGVSQNAVFTAFDGDLSLVNLDDFGPAVSISPVPLPATLPMLFGALAAFGFWRRKSSKA